MEQFNEDLYFNLSEPPQLFNYQHMLHYIPEGQRQHGTMAAA